MDQNSQGRRPHYHRGRRSPERRGHDRRSAQVPAQAGDRGGKEGVDVEQVMREIRARIAQRQGIELTEPQIQELAARRLEAILDARSIDPKLLQQLRRAAAEPPDVGLPPGEGFTFEDTTLYDSHRGILRAIRKLLHPVLKLFFNPNPLISALHTQARLNREAVAREAERDRRQAEWNALHFEILQRLVTEVSRVSLDVHALSLRVESLAARVDFSERRVRGVEAAVQGIRAPGRQPVDASAPAPPSSAAAAGGAEAAAEGLRRRRRRRRRRGGVGGQEPAPAPAEDIGAADLDDGEGDEPIGEKSSPLGASGETLRPRDLLAAGGAEPAVEPSNVSGGEGRPAEAPAPIAPADLALSEVSPPPGTGSTTADAAISAPRDEPEPPRPTPDAGPPDR